MHVYNKKKKEKKPKKEKKKFSLSRQVLHSHVLLFYGVFSLYCSVSMCLGSFAMDIPATQIFYVQLAKRRKKT